jgi:hypothetical protein
MPLDHASDMPSDLTSTQAATLQGSLRPAIGAVAEPQYTRVPREALRIAVTTGCRRPYRHPALRVDDASNDRDERNQLKMVDN